jgi:hypothetical protein
MWVSGAAGTATKAGGVPNANGAGIAADPALTDVVVPGGTRRRSVSPMGRSRRARASGARAGNRFRRAGRSGPRAKGSLSFTATTRRFRSLFVRCGRAMSADPAHREGAPFPDFSLLGSVGTEVPRFSLVLRSSLGSACASLRSNLAGPDDPANRNEPLAASAVRLGQTRRLDRDVFSDATAGSATVSDGFIEIPLPCQTFRSSSSTGFSAFR